MAEKLNQRDRARMMCGVYELLMRLKVFSPAAEVGEMWTVSPPLYLFDPNYSETGRLV